MWCLRLHNTNKMAVTAILLTAFLLHQMGCSSVHRESLEETVRRHSQEEIGYQIAGVSTTADTIWFDGFGGTYLPDRATITGTTSDKQSAEVSLDSVAFLRNYRGPDAIPSKLVFDRTAFESSFKVQEFEKIRAIELRDSTRVAFDSAGGYIDQISRVVTGATESGTSTSVPWGHISSVEIKRPSNTNRFLLVSAGVLILLSIAAIATFDEAVKEAFEKQ